MLEKLLKNRKIYLDEVEYIASNGEIVSEIKSNLGKEQSSQFREHWLILVLGQYNVTSKM